MSRRKAAIRGAIPFISSLSIGVSSADMLAQDSSPANLSDDK
jgi:hypothetical protein